MQVFSTSVLLFASRIKFCQSIRFIAILLAKATQIIAEYGNQKHSSMVDYLEVSFKNIVKRILKQFLRRSDRENFLHTTIE